MQAVRRCSSICLSYIGSKDWRMTMCQTASFSSHSLADESVIAVSASISTDVSANAAHNACRSGCHNCRCQAKSPASLSLSLSLSSLGVLTLVSLLEASSTNTVCPSSRRCTNISNSVANKVSDNHAFESLSSSNA